MGNEKTLKKKKKKDEISIKMSQKKPFVFHVCEITVIHMHTATELYFFVCNIHLQCNRRVKPFSPVQFQMIDACSCEKIRLQK